ncbi:MAG: (2Fe-2S)-binding protein [Planctomycetes bacterium]|jgi:NAD(P)H-nitrite reductase large subunit|nr:(2Fe-2S)-binding protein [Planctomycetota bacterium]
MSGHEANSPSGTMRIDRCVCVDVTFAQMRAHADRCGSTDVAELRSAFRCAEGCGLCEPYIERMLQSQTVVFDEVIPPRPCQAER